jgi:hypothetical protein
MGNRAFGLRELLGRQIDGVENEDQLGRRFGRRQRVVQGADLCRLAVVEKDEVRGREVRNRVPCRICHGDVNGEEALVHDGIGGGQGRERLSCFGRISQRRGLSACPPGTNNKEACEKSPARRDSSIHHDSPCPGRLAASMTGTASGMVAASPRSDAQTKPRMRPSRKY